MRRRDRRLREALSEACCAAAAVALGMLAGAGCGDAREMVSEPIREAADAGCDKARELLLDEFERAGIAVRELAGDWEAGRWEDAARRVAEIDDAEAREVVATIGETLVLEEVEGVDGCSERIDEMLAADELTPARRQTLSVMKSYVNGKGGLRTVDLAALIALVYLSVNGFDAGFITHGGTLQYDVAVFLGALEEARRAFRAKPEESQSASQKQKVQDGPGGARN